MYVQVLACARANDAKFEHSRDAQRIDLAKPKSGAPRLSILTVTEGLYLNLSSAL